MSTAKELLDLLHAKVQIRTREGDYEGIIARVIPSTCFLQVQYIYFLPERINLGALNFRFNEVKILKVITPPPIKTEKDSTSSSHSTWKPSRKEYCILDDYNSDCEDEEETAYPEVVEGQYIPKYPPHLNRVLPRMCEVIDTIGEEFYNSIEHIKDQESIGLTLEGPNISRYGEISFLNICTRRRTLLYDIKSLGKTAFSRGLRSILGNPSILKVVHDCRPMSDCLYHKYQCKLSHVFDIQVADMFYRMINSQQCKLTKNANTLNMCLSWYLEVPEEFLHRHKKVSINEDQRAYYEARPLQRELCDIMVHNVCYLLLLRREVELGMNTPFRRAMDVYLHALKDSSDRELLMDPYLPEEVPKAVFQDGIQIVRFKEVCHVPDIVSSGSPYAGVANPIVGFQEYYERFEINQKKNPPDDKHALDVKENVGKKISVECTNAVTRDADNDSGNSTNDSEKHCPSVKLTRKLHSSNNRKTCDSQDSSSKTYAESLEPSLPCVNSQPSVQPAQTHQKIISNVQHDRRSFEPGHHVNMPLAGKGRGAILASLIQNQRSKSSLQVPGQTCMKNNNASDSLPTVGRTFDLGDHLNKPTGMGRGALLASFFQDHRLKLSGSQKTILPTENKPFDWSVFRETFDDDELNSEHNKKLRFVPSGMGC